MASSTHGSTIHRLVPDVRAAAGVATASVAAGAATSYAQGFLPDAVNSFANSASGWTLVTVLLIRTARVRPAVAAALGATSFVLLTLGYTAASAVRGFTYHPEFWIVVGLVVGPMVGLATAWLRERDLRAALATAALAGIALGESVYGLTAISDSTSPVYWTVVGLAGVVLLAGMVLRRIRNSVNIVAALGLTAVVTAGLPIVFLHLV